VKFGRNKKIVSGAIKIHKEAKHEIIIGKREKPNYLKMSLNSQKKGQLKSLQNYKNDRGVTRSATPPEDEKKNGENLTKIGGDGNQNKKDQFANGQSG